MQGVIGGHLGGGIDRRQPAADHHRRQADLEIGQRVLLERAGELQRHEEIARLPHAADQVVLQTDQGRLPRAGGQRDVVEAVAIERVFQRDGTAEARAAVELEVRAAQEVQVQHVEERLVPAHGDPVFGDAAESAGDALVEGRAEHLLESLDGPRQQVLGERLDLQAIDADHAEAFVEQMVGERVPGGAHAHHQHVDAAIRARVLPRKTQGIPTC